MRHPQLDEILFHFSRECDRCLGSHRQLLFGSQCRGTAKPSSDIDIAVIIDERKPLLCDKLTKAIAQISHHYKVRINAFCTSKSRYEKDTTPFYRTLKREAQTIDQFLGRNHEHL